MQSLEAQPFTPPMTAYAAGVPKDRLRLWLNRGLLRTPLPEPRAGKARQFNWLGVVEATLLSAASAQNISLRLIAAAMDRRLDQAAEAAGCDRCNIARMAPHLPEFLAGGANRLWWLDTAVMKRGDEIVLPDPGVRLLSKGDQIPDEAFVRPTTLLICVNTYSREAAQRLAEYQATQGQGS